MNCSLSICPIRPSASRSSRSNWRSASAIRRSSIWKRCLPLRKDIPARKSTPRCRARCTLPIPEKKPLTTQSLVDALAQTVPLSTTRAEEIKALREWAGTRAVPASARDKGSATDNAVDFLPLTPTSPRGRLKAMVVDLPDGHAHFRSVPVSEQNSVLFIRWSRYRLIPTSQGGRDVLSRSAFETGIRHTV